ncbi:MAG: hypothetical protein KC503_20235 [Myxococcales bacterium]|nr:hypothetical protein [Myxococcales bacterium]
MRLSPRLSLLLLLPCACALIACGAEPAAEITADRTAMLVMTANVGGMIEPCG